MKNDVMLGEIGGKRRRGSPRARWLDNLTTYRGDGIWSGGRVPWSNANAYVSMIRPRLEGTRRRRCDYVNN